MREQGHGARKVLPNRFLVFETPLGYIVRKAPERKPPRIKVETRVNRAAAVETTSRIGSIEVVNQARYLNTLVFVQRMLEQRARFGAVVPHQVLANQPAGVGKPVREQVRLRQQQQLRRFNSIRTEHHHLREWS